MFRGNKAILLGQCFNHSSNEEANVQTKHVCIVKCEHLNKMEASNLQSGNDHLSDDTNQLQNEGAELNDLGDCIDDFNNFLTLHDLGNDIEDFDVDEIIDTLEAEQPLNTSVQVKQSIFNPDEVDSKAEFKDQVADDSNSASTSFWPAQHQVKPRNTKEILNIKLKQKLKQEGKVIPMKDDESKTKLVIQERSTTRSSQAFKALRQAGTPMAGPEPATEGSQQIPGRTHKPLCHRRPYRSRRGGGSEGKGDDRSGKRMKGANNI
ncbi:hypothetical protein PoB_005516600 [Plakobranchus ocellatus]|uniref:Uncharacterized protein n=1 Tax=Plakobranchus ocellatus TaxID=259542 RepID=A0AAV4BZW8_9GAST|nr:hypothetical protein PoB_005516600 [Plakobranchus ocellatus]